MGRLMWGDPGWIGSNLTGPEPGGTWEEISGLSLDLDVKMTTINQKLLVSFQSFELLV